MEQTSTQKDTTNAVIAYITLIGLIIAIVQNQLTKNPFTSFHIRQSLGLGICGLGLMILSFIPFIGWLIYLIGILGLIALWILGLIAAINGKEEPLPVVGEHFQNWFKKL